MWDNYLNKTEANVFYVSRFKKVQKEVKDTSDKLIKYQILHKNDLAWEEEHTEESGKHMRSIELS